MSTAAPPRARRRRPVPGPRPVRRERDRATLCVWGMMAAWAGLMTWLSIARHRAFFTGRFDLGNMVQAAWSTAHGDLLATTDAGGRQISRLAAHVDPVLVLFAPFYRFTDSAVPLLVGQALIVALGALPAFWLGRRWLGDDRLALAGAAVWLLYPPLMWATLTEFHPVTLAAPLLMYCIWAAEEGRLGVLAVCAPLALLCKEEVGLALVVLGIWMAVRHRRRLAGAVLAGASLAWVIVALAVIVPHFNRGRGSEFVSRYGELGSGTGDVLRTLVTRPWEAAEVAVSHHRVTYLLALLIPLLLLPLAAPLLAAGALPELGLNLLSGWWPQYSIEFQYVAVIVPFLVAAALLGLARLRAAAGPRWLVRATERTGALAAVMVAAVVVAGIGLGPLPWWRHLPLGATSRAGEYSAGAHAAVLREAVALVPDGASVSAGNYLGAHLSARRRITTFPVVDGAEWVLVDRRRPAMGFLIRPKEHARAVAAVLRGGRYRVVLDRDGVLVLRRRAGGE
jgi:uncharacterized membrane protein